MHRTWICVAVVWLMVRPASGQTPLTEADVLARLSVNSPRVRALRAHIDVARAEVLAARRFPNPRVTFNREAVAGVSEDFVLVSQALPISGVRRLEVAAAEARVRAVEFRAGDLERRARAELRLAFVALFAEQNREREILTTLTSLRELADILAKRERAGDVAGFDRLRAEREVVELEADLGRVRIDRALAQAEIAAFFAPPVDVSAIVVGIEAPPPARLPALDVLLARAESGRGDLLAFQQEIESSVFARRAADRRLIPEPEVVGGLKTSSVATDNRGSVFSVVASIPLFDRARPERARAEAAERQAAASLALARAEVRARIAGLRAAVETARTAADGYRSAALTRSTDLERIARVSYEAGERTILEVLDAYRTAADARLRQIALDADAARAQIELELAAAWEGLR